MRARVGLLALCLLIPGVFASAAKHGPEGPIAKVDGGVIRGEMRGGAAVFEGIPYAAPPVGAMRWREPQPVAAWKGIRDATKPGNSCVQDTTGFDVYFKPIVATYGLPYTSQWGMNATRSSEVASS